METLHLTKAGTGKYYLLGSDLVTVKAGSRETSGTMLVLEVMVPAGGGPPMLHRHVYAETFYFLEGTFTVSTTDSHSRLHTQMVQPGDVLAIPSMAWHNFKNTGSTPGRFLVVHSSPVMEGLLQELGQPLAKPLFPAAGEMPPTPQQLQNMLQILGKYMEFLPAGKLMA
jgi:mannose-6-phosphate isomerase-like protein (cupin superfamily)